MCTLLRRTCVELRSSTTKSAPRLCQCPITWAILEASGAEMVIQALCVRGEGTDRATRPRRVSNQSHLLAFDRICARAVQRRVARDGEATWINLAPYFETS
jgi:hypothetical protein